MRYEDLFQSGELLQRVKTGYGRLRSCDLCPNECRVDRLAGEVGSCRSGERPKVASTNVHHGEEPPISGTRGSGTIFFSGCTLKCKFCQNFPISQLGNGVEMTPSILAGRMMKLQKQQVHNINLVTPGHFLPQFLAALWLAIPQGFRLPVVWNSSGYERVDALQLLDGVIDLYLPDMKYVDNEPAVRFSSAPGYREINRLAVAEMFRQVGHLQVDSLGVAVRGTVIRHLVLPEGNAGSRETLCWIAENLGTETYISLMKQFFPANEAVSIAGIQRKVHDTEYEEAVAALEAAGLGNGWIQE